MRRGQVVYVVGAHTGNRRGGKGGYAVGACERAKLIGCQPGNLRAGQRTSLRRRQCGQLCRRQGVEGCGRQHADLCGGQTGNLVGCQIGHGRAYNLPKTDTGTTLKSRPIRNSCS